MSRSIYWKITLPLVAMIVVTMGVLGFFIIDSAKNNQVSQKETITIIGVLGLLTLLVIVATVIIARMITRPVRQITGAAEGIAAGKMDQQIPVRSDDEIGRLGRAFNEMSTSVKKTLAKVDEERSRLIAILSGLTDGVVMTDSQGRIVLANLAAERLFNFKEIEAIGKPLIEVAKDHEIDALLKNCIDTSHEQSLQIVLTSGRFLRAIAVPIATGEITGALMLFQDLTELRSLQTMRREFVGNISHELRTPLAGMKAIVETLRDGAINDREAAADFLNRLEVEVDGLTQMVTELIELTRIETGRIKLYLEPVNLNLLVDEVIARLSPQADRQQISLLPDLMPDLPSVPADMERIRQVIMNIVHNAIKFTPTGGKVVVSTRIDDQSVTVRVSDTGIGISKQDMPHIFERFFKADKSRSSRGTGLGLAIARHTLQVHGGDISVQSELGKGSTFIISLPVSPNQSNNH